MAHNYVLGQAAADWVATNMRKREPVRLSRSSRRNGLSSPAQTLRCRAFEVRYGASAATSGAWIVYLPAGCLRIDNTTVNPAAALAPAGGDYAAGWYQLGFSPASGVWLNIAAASGGGWSASFAATASGDHSVFIAGVDDYNVTQLVVGSLVLAIGRGARKSITVETPLGIREDQRQGAGNLITIYPDGMTATLDVVLGVEYDPETHELTYAKKRLVYDKGLLVDVLDLYSDVATTAVEETV